MFVIQFNMKWVEQVGLVKFDFFGLKILMVIQFVMNLIFKLGCDLYIVVDGCKFYDLLEGGVNQINLILLDDKVIYDFYFVVKMVVVFQVESLGMMLVLCQMKLICIEDVVVFVVLYCLGLMENIFIYCDVKYGCKEFEFVYLLIDYIFVEI